MTALPRQGMEVNATPRQDELTEALLIPYRAEPPPRAARVAVLAPHPDDEVFGCGGALALHVARGENIRVVIATDGAGSAAGADENHSSLALVARREEESRAAAAVLGYPAPTFWRLPDRGLAYGAALVDRIVQLLQGDRIDLVYAPSLHEVHPDHRALAMAAAEAVRRIGQGIRIAFYEVGAPLQPNLLVDLSSVLEKKRAAIRCFASQLAVQRYDEHIEALNRYRTYTLPENVAAAEAFEIVDAASIALDHLALFTPAYRRRQALGLPASGRHDLPLVSIIIRSMDRDYLDDALDSIAWQTYPDIEIVLVNAKGGEHRDPGTYCGPYPLRLINREGAPLGRSAAANAGMQEARGTYCMFLDDDDWFAPPHVDLLVQHLLAAPRQQVAYSGIATADAQRKPLATVFNRPFDRVALLSGNYIPIHAVLFLRELFSTKNCRFDTTLDVYEDWDFWVQVSQFGDFLHVDQITGFYRILPGAGIGVAASAEIQQKNAKRVHDKWIGRVSADDWQEVLRRVDELRLAKEECTLQREALTALHAALGAKEQVMAEQQGRIRFLTARHAASEASIEALKNSTSWRVTRPLRFVALLLRGDKQALRAGLRHHALPWGRLVYRRLPQRLRPLVMALVFRVAGRLFTGVPRYELWRQGTGQKQHGASLSQNIRGLIDIDTVAPLTHDMAGSIAIHLHLYYPDLAEEFARHLSAMPFSFDLYVSVTGPEGSAAAAQHFSALPRLGKLVTSTVPNRGRDIAPMLCEFGSRIKEYDFIAHIHSKKSLYNKGATAGWREYLVGGLFGSENRIRRIFRLLDDSSGYGLVYPQNFFLIPYAANTWLANQSLGHAWCQRLGIEPIPTGYFDFPVGSMFWARGAALRPLFDSNIQLDQFPAEEGQTDGTLAHCLERLLALTTLRSGLRVGILKDTGQPSWSPWRFDQYLARCHGSFIDSISGNNIKIVAFDIFDTLLIRPLLTPEACKSMVARRVDPKLADAYMRWRVCAEGEARDHKGRDVDIDDIFLALKKLSGLDTKSIDTLKSIEIETERRSVMPRHETISFMQEALGLGKRVVLISDMFLPQQCVETMLAENGITGWHGIYLSSAIGLRKDTGDLYRHLLEREQVEPGGILIVGDNERSDLQLPTGLGMQAYHVLRPIELARASPRLAPLIQKALAQKDANDELTLGLLTSRHFNPVSYPAFDSASLIPGNPQGIGYAVLGPLLLSFVQWLSGQAQREGIKRLYFLAREGEFIKEAYDHWLGADPSAPAAEYLVLSRRAISVPTIETIEDIYRIARTDFLENSVDQFLEVRYGITLAENEWGTIEQAGLWKRGRKVDVRDGRIDALRPLLEHLSTKIRARATGERAGLLAYLEELGLCGTGEPVAVVDVGYSGTIQGYLNRLLERKIHGYYFATNERARAVSEQYAVVAAGCFAHHVVPTGAMPPIFEKSFALEKLLSSNAPQITRYALDAAGRAVAHYRALGPAETGSQKTRDRVRGDAMAFLADAAHIGKALLPDFTVAPALANALFDTLIQEPSTAEEALLGDIVLDDHYCGRDLVF